jgi:hypothetical protein
VSGVASHGLLNVKKNRLGYGEPSPWNKINCHKSSARTVNGRNLKKVAFFLPLSFLALKSLGRAFPISRPSTRQIFGGFIDCPSRSETNRESKPGQIELPCLIATITDSSKFGALGERFITKEYGSEFWRRSKRKMMKSGSYSGVRGIIATCFSFRI